MRTIWLSMRDEEPPERGLAALLAAARDQVAATPPWRPLWLRLLRLLIGLRRPPVFALATIAVLLGVAALVARRADQVAVPEAAVAGEPTAPVPRAGPPFSPVELLCTQCESAARRGDCVAVRRIMGRITQIDRDHHVRLAKGAAIAKCLADRPE